MLGIVRRLLLLLFRRYNFGTSFGFGIVVSRGVISANCRAALTGEGIGKHGQGHIVAQSLGQDPKHTAEVCQLAGIG